MSADQLIASLDAHMDVLRAIFSWGVVLALAMGWAGIRNAKELEIGKLKMGRTEAFYVGSLAYALGALAFLIGVLRLTAMLDVVASDRFVEAYSKLATHEWLQNPFGFFGTSNTAQISCAGGIGMLIVGWWLCATAVTSLRFGELKTWKLIWPLLPFYVFGIASLWFIWTIYATNLTRLEAIAPALHEQIKATAPARWAGAFAGLFTGLVIMRAALKWRKTSKSDSVPRETTAAAT